MQSIQIGYFIWSTRPYQGIPDILHCCWLLIVMNLRGSIPYFCTSSSHQMCSIKKSLLKSFAKFTESTCAKVSFLIKLQANTCNFIKDETLRQMFSSEFSENFKNTFFTEHPWATNSVFGYIDLRHHHICSNVCFPCLHGLDCFLWMTSKLLCLYQGLCWFPSFLFKSLLCTSFQVFLGCLLEKLPLTLKVLPRAIQF